MMMVEDFSTCMVTCETETLSRGERLIEWTEKENVSLEGMTQIPEICC